MLKTERGACTATQNFDLDENEIYSTGLVHAKDAVSTHRNIFDEKRAWCVSTPLDLAAMQQAADYLRNDSKETDYTSFRNAGCTSSTPVRRIINFTVERAEGYASIDFDIAPGNRLEVL